MNPETKTVPLFEPAPLY